MSITSYLIAAAAAAFPAVGRMLEPQPDTLPRFLGRRASKDAETIRKAEAKRARKMAKAAHRFGAGVAVRGMLAVYQQTAKQTGRTTAMLDRVKDGDRIVFADPREAERVRRMLRDRQANVECVTCPPSDLRGLLDRPPAVGRLVFDHGWIELYYRDVVQRAQGDLDAIVERGSGPKDEPRESRYMPRWRG